ncbi:MAG: metallophosphoesterase [Kofleriaceae bacterium]
MSSWFSSRPRSSCSALALALFATACHGGSAVGDDDHGDDDGTGDPKDAPGHDATDAPDTPMPGEPHLLIAAGDVASSDPNDTQTANLVDTLDGTIILLGDNAYSNGSTANYQDYFEPTWGKFKSRIHPTPGNHEYRTTDASGYFDYFGAAAGDPDKGYYSFDLGNWHLIAINTNGEDECDEIACNAGSAQEQWLRDDLAANTKPCTLAYWHHPRWSSGEHGNGTGTQALWQALFDAKAEMVLAGHDHDYERFKPLDDQGAVDPTNGITQIVVGTGGRKLRDFDADQPAITEIRNGKTYGVLHLKLYDDRAEYEFKPIAGSTFTDSGTVTCH